MQAKSNEPDPTYSVTISGAPTAYSTGGGVPVLLQAATVAAVPALPLLLVLLIFAREAFVHGLLRPIFFLYAKHDRETVAKTGIRKRIMQLIEESPGLSLAALHRTLQATQEDRQLGRTTLRYHLCYLENAEKLVSKRVGNVRVYFQTGIGGAPLEYKRITLLQSSLNARISKAILDEPGLRQVDLQARLGRDGFAGRTLLIYYLRRLASEGLLRQEREGRSRRWHPTPTMLALKDYVRPADETRSSAPANGSAPQTATSLASP